MRRTARSLLATGMIAAAAVGGSLVTAAPAAAADHKNGYVESGEFGLFCNSYQGSSVFDLYYDDENFSGDYFIGSLSCAGQSVNDNTASYWNRDILDWEVYTDAYRRGVRGTIPGGENYRGNASATFKNEISSAYFV